MQLVDFRRQLHYRGIFIIFLIWRLFMNNTQKALINQDVCEQTTPNLGITQSSGLDRHCIYARQRVDEFKDGEVVSTQSARQHKDATDLVVDVAGLDCRNAAENGDLCGTLQKGTSGSSLNSIHPIRNGLLIRRLTPLECERLQGFPDGWTDIPGASDSARYKALGNSVYWDKAIMLMMGTKMA